MGDALDALMAGMGGPSRARPPIGGPIGGPTARPTPHSPAALSTPQILAANAVRTAAPPRRAYGLGEASQLAAPPALHPKPGLGQAFGQGLLGGGGPSYAAGPSYGGAPSRQAPPPSSRLDAAARQAPPPPSSGAARAAAPHGARGRRCGARSRVGRGRGARRGASRGAARFAADALPVAQFGDRPPHFGHSLAASLGASHAATSRPLRQ